MREAGIAPLLCALGLAAACEANNPVYVPPMGPLEVGQPGGMAASASSTVTLGFRNPTEEERALLRSEGQRLMQPLPWLRADHVAVSVLYTITNVDSKRGEARLEINGASEFASYDAAALRAAALMANPDEDEVVVFSLIQPTPVRLAAGESVSGTVREDDFREAALDLDAIGRWMAEPTSVLINRSDVNPVGLDKLPARLVLPALYQVQVTFSATAHMRLEFMVRVRDEKKQLLEPGGEPFAPMPRAYMPAMSSATLVPGMQPMATPPAMP
jgi:hypothetical protein